MLQYRPPKSSVWGHFLRGMLPSKQRALCEAFLTRTVSGIVHRRIGFSIQRLPDAETEPFGVISEFENIFSRASQGGRFELSEKEIDFAFAVLIERESRFLDLPYVVTLSDSFRIGAWSIRGNPSPTDSAMFWNYGSQPHVSTMLQFVSRDEFYFIQEVLGELGLMRLNEKHLKEIKRKQKHA